jgi:hypothetical protein
VRARGGGSLIAVTTTGVTMTGSNAYWVSKAADLRPDNIAVNCLSPSRVVLTEGWQAGGAGMETPPEMVEPPEAMARAAVLLAAQDASGVTGTVQRFRRAYLRALSLRPGRRSPSNGRRGRRVNGQLVLALSLPTIVRKSSVWNDCSSAVLA